MNLRFTARATQDLEAIATYIRLRSPAAARSVRAAILHSLQDVLLFPQAGRRQSPQGVRKFVTRKYGYLIYYMIDQAADEAVVLSVQHPARDREYEDG